MPCQSTSGWECPEVCCSPSSEIISGLCTGGRQSRGCPAQLHGRTASSQLGLKALGLRSRTAPTPLPKHTGFSPLPQAGGGEPGTARSCLTWRKANTVRKKLQPLSHLQRDRISEGGHSHALVGLGTATASKFSCLVCISRFQGALGCTLYPRTAETEYFI